MLHENNLELLSAARDGDESVVKRLLEQGAEVNSRDRSGLTPLHHAARNGHIAVIELLSARGS